MPRCPRPLLLPVVLASPKLIECNDRIAAILSTSRISLASFGSYAPTMTAETRPMLVSIVPLTLQGRLKLPCGITISVVPIMKDTTPGPQTYL